MGIKELVAKCVTVENVAVAIAPDLYMVTITIALPAISTNKKMHAILLRTHEEVLDLVAILRFMDGYDPSALFVTREKDTIPVSVEVQNLIINKAVGL